MKKLLAIAFAVIIITGLIKYNSAPVDGITSLTDIEGNWASEQINYLVSQRVVSGYSDQTFRPGSNITRAEFITLVNRAFNYAHIVPVHYRDVMPDEWYFMEVERAAAAGYLPDYYQDLIEADRFITREEAAYIMAAVLYLDTTDPGAMNFSDSGSISAGNRKAVAAVAGSGCMKGYPDKTFRPLNPISRAEAAVIIFNGLNLSKPSAGGLNVRDYGARGDNQTDDTASIQRAIDAAYSQGGGTVVIPDGIYSIDPDVSVKLRHNTKLSLSPDAVLQALPTASVNNSVVNISNVNNAGLVGGKIIGDRDIHLGTGGEWGMGINIIGSNNIYVAGVEVSDCWGDGIFVGGGIGPGAQNFSQNVIIENFKLDNNRRQGISVISAKNLIIRDGEISNTHGTLPESGIDLEPDNSSEFLQNVLIENIRTFNNAGYGIEIWLGPYMGSNNPLSIKIRNYADKGSRKGGLHKSNFRYYQSMGYDIVLK